MTDIARILIAPLAWLAAFSAVYGLQGVLCGHGLQVQALAGVLRPEGVLAAAWLLAVAVQVILLWALYSPRFGSTSGFVRFVSRATGWVGLVAALWTLFPAVVASWCL
jgi:hypothetical protein